MWERREIQVYSHWYEPPEPCFKYIQCELPECLPSNPLSSSETQGQIKGARESLNGQKNIYGTKKSKERREEPLGTMSYQTSSKRSPPFWLLIGARKTQVFWHQSEARTAATIWNWSGKTLSPGALLAVLYFSSFDIYFSGRLDFPSPPLSAPGSLRMTQCLFRYFSPLDKHFQLPCVQEGGVY